MERKKYSSLNPSSREITEVSSAINKELYDDLWREVLNKFERGRKLSPQIKVEEPVGVSVVRYETPGTSLNRW